MIFCRNLKLYFWRYQGVPILTLWWAMRPWQSKIVKFDNREPRQVRFVGTEGLNFGLFQPAGYATNRLIEWIRYFTPHVWGRCFCQVLTLLIFEHILQHKILGVFVTVMNYSFQNFSRKIHLKCLRSFFCWISTPRFPMRQIGAFRPLRRHCARLRHRRMLWLVSKGRARFFYHKLKLEHLSNHTFSHKSKKKNTKISQI